MKKFITILAMVMATSAFADKIIIDVRDAQGTTTTGPHTSGTTSPSQNQYRLTFVKDVDANWQVDYTIFSAQSQATQLAHGGSIEAGAVYKNRIGSMPWYLRGGFGQKITPASNFPYYSMEPGVVIPMGSFTGRVGYRFSNAVEPAAARADETRTWRYSLGYNFDNNNSLWLRYDRMRGDFAQNVTFVSYEYKW